MPLAEPTGRAVRIGSIVSLSQPDWVCAVALLPDLVDLQSEGQVVVAVTDRRVPSEHEVVFLGAADRSVLRRNAIPDFVAQSAEFAEEVAGLREVEPPTHTGPFKVLWHMKRVMRRVAQTVQRWLRHRAPATPRAPLVLALQQLRRLWRSGEWQLAARKSVLHPPFAAAVRSPEIGQWGPLTQAIQEAGQDESEHFAHERERDEATRPSRPREYQRARSRLWVPAGKRLALDAMRNQAGGVLDPAGSLAELARHWAPQFARRDVLPHLAVALDSASKSDLQEAM